MDGGIIEPRGIRQSEEVTRPIAPEEREPPEAAGFPEWLDAYRRDVMLGRGGMGVVWRYRDTRLDRFVAMKALPVELSRDHGRRERFLGEARVVAALAHPNIAAIHHLLEHRLNDYLVLEYVPGRTLGRELRAGAIPFERTLSIGLQLARAIQAGHAKTIVHRDIKPGNVMITPEGTAKLLDYGLAGRQQPEGATAEVDALRAEAGEDACAQRLEPREARALADLVDGAAPPSMDSRSLFEPSVAGAPARHDVIGGTPGYMSPEQANGQPTDARADLWALGCVLFECFAGRPAFPGSTDRARMLATLTLDPPWNVLPENVDTEVRRLLERCLARRIEERLADAEGACTVLARAIERRRGAGGAHVVPSSIPRHLTSFVEREGELERLDQVVAFSRLLTLTGPGGAGKTRLAGELARSIAEGARAGARSIDCRDGIYFVELADTKEGRFVSHAIAAALGGEVERTRGRSMTDRLSEAIGERHLLLVLDNCEHLVRECAALVERLLRRCPHLRVVATSREALGVAGEHVYAVPDMGLPPPGTPPSRLRTYAAVRLFIERAKEARPELAPDDAALAHVAEICRRVEGVPLAIELAAASVRAFDVEEISRRLFDVIDPRRRLESSIAWSVELLSPAERMLLGRLSLFRGGWTLEAAEAVCGDAGGACVASVGIARVLGELVHKSLVQYRDRGDRGRYHLLEMVRGYAFEHLLAKEDVERLRRRHVDFFLALAESAMEHAVDAEQPAWLDRLEVEHENLRGALESTVGAEIDPVIGVRLPTALHYFWSLRGHQREGLAWIEAAIARREGAQDVAQLRALNSAGILAWSGGAFDRAKRHYDASLRIAQACGDKRRAAGVLTNLGLIAQDEGDLAGSRRFHNEALEVYRELSDHLGVAHVRLNLAWLARLAGSFDEARRLIEESLPVFRREGDIARIAAAAQNLAEIACDEGRADEATSHLRESLALHMRLRDPKLTADTIVWVGVWCGLAGRYGEAADLLAAAEALRRSAGVDAEPSAETRYHRSFAALVARLAELPAATANQVDCKMGFDEAARCALAALGADERPVHV